ncbi:MAG: ParB N-terminal domain-containing protein [Chloroflexi bacterium]|nr:ParB N-terminal domain-containing protein [Chloroflexota bacterium]
MTSSPIANPNILWGAAAAAVLGATLADWQKKREEEAARLAAMRSNVGGEEEESSGKGRNPGRIAYEKKMQQKHIIGELQAAAKISQAKPVNQLAKIDTDEERLEAYKQTAGYQARQEHYAEYYAKKEQEKQNAVSAARWAGVASVAQEKQEEENKWQEIFEKWTSPAKLSSGLTYGKPQWVDTLPLTLQIPLELIYKKIDNIPPKISTSNNKILNGASNAISFLSGTTRQLTNDLAFGLPGFITGWKPKNGNEFYQDGRMLGRTLSTYYGYFEMLVGGALLIDGAVKFVASVGGSIGCSIFGGPSGGAACAAASTPIVIAGTTEMVGGAIVAGHGGAVVWNNANNPLKIQDNSGNSGIAGREKVPLKGKVNDLPDGVEWLDIKDPRIKLSHSVSRDLNDLVTINDIKMDIEVAGYDANNPIILVEFPDGTLSLYQGHHRLQAVSELGYTKIPARILHVIP